MELGDRADWGTREELLAAVFDRLGELVELTHRAHFQGPHPDVGRLPRPGEGGRSEQVALAEPPRMSSAAEIRSFFGAAIKYSES